MAKKDKLKVVKKDEDIPILKSLTENEMLNLQVLISDIGKKNLEIENTRQKIENKHLYMSNLKLQLVQIDREISSMKEEIAYKDKKLDISKKNHNEYHSKITNKYDLGVNWGFDVNTGEVKENS